MGRIDALKLPPPVFDRSFSAWIKGIFGRKSEPECPLCGANVIRTQNMGKLYFSCPVCDYEHTCLSFDRYK